MDVGHTDSDEAKAVDLRETRRRFLLAVNGTESKLVTL